MNKILVLTMETNNNTSVLCVSRNRGKLITYASNIIGDTMFHSDKVKDNELNIKAKQKVRTHLKENDEVAIETIQHNVYFDILTVHNL